MTLTTETTTGRAPLLAAPAAGTRAPSAGHVGGEPVLRLLVELERPDAPGHGVVGELAAGGAVQEVGGPVVAALEGVPAHHDVGEPLDQHGLRTVHRAHVA